MDLTWSLHGLYETFAFILRFGHETAIAEMLLLQNVFLVTILLVCVYLIEELEGEKRNTAKTIDNLKAVNARQNSLHELWLFQLVWVKKSQTVQKIVNERNKIRALPSFQSTLLTELLLRTLYIVYGGQTIANNSGRISQFRRNSKSSSILWEFSLF